MDSELKTERQVSYVAILSVILGLAGLVTFGLSAVLGLIFGIIASYRIHRSEGRLSGQAFALVGMMISGVIVVYVLSVAIAFRGKEELARLNKANADVKNYSTALDLFELDNGFYPSTQQGLQALLTQPTTPPVPINWRGPYLQRNSVPNDPWGRPYLYMCPGTGNITRFDLSSAGPNGVYGDKDDIIAGR